MAFTRQQPFSKKTTDLPDVPSPTYTASQIKEYIETPSDENKTFVDGFIDELEAETGAGNIGAEDINGDPSTVQAETNKANNGLKTHKTATTLDHPDKSVTEPKLADGSVSRRTIQAGAVGTNEIDPSIMSQPTTAIGVQAKFDSIDSQLADIAINVKKYGAKGDGVTDDTTAIQNAINSLTNNAVLLFPKGEYSITSLSISGLDNIKIMGYGATLYGDSNTKNMIELNNVKFIYFEGIKFSFRNKPTDYFFTAGIQVNVNDYKGVYFDRCIFDEIAGTAIFADNAKDDNDVTAGTTSSPIVIDKCYFMNQVTPTSQVEKYSAIFLGVDGEYAVITNNDFRKCWQAIRGVGGANTLVDGNTIMSSTATYALNMGLIYFSNSSSNSAKVSILNNRINHNGGGAFAIVCISDPTRNEKRFTLHNNYILVHGNSTYSKCVYLKDNVSSVLTDNYLSPINGNLEIITLENCTNVIIDNNTGQYAVLLRLINSSVIIGDNILETPSASVTGKITKDSTSIVIPKSGAYLFRINTAGTLGSESDNPWTVVKNGTGDFTITHNLGHLEYVVNNPVADNQSTPCLFSVIRTTTTIQIKIFDNTGAPVDANFMGTIQVNKKNKFN